MAGRDESSRIASKVAASVDVQDADGTTSETGGVGAGCSIDRQAACFALLNVSLVYAANVTNERGVVPDFDDESLGAICR